MLKIGDKVKLKAVPYSDFANDKTQANKFYKRYKNKNGIVRQYIKKDNLKGFFEIEVLKGLNFVISLKYLKKIKGVK